MAKSDSQVLPFLTDEQAAELAAACPFWKILADCHVEIAAEAHAVAMAANSIYILSAFPVNQDIIQNDGTVTAAATEYAMAAHGEVKALNAMKSRLGTIYYELAMAITKSTYKGNVNG